MSNWNDDDTDLERVYECGRCDGEASGQYRLGGLVVCAACWYEEQGPEDDKLSLRDIAILGGEPSS
jgi:hypothetical protein